jgi:predicted phage terminase large subunit-like protein
MAKAKRSRNFGLFENPGPTYAYKDEGLGLFGALILAALAYPEAKFKELRVTTAKRLSGRSHLSSLGEPAGPWIDVRGPLGVAAIPVDCRKPDAGSSRLETRLQRRLSFGLLVLQPVLAAESGEPPLSLWGGRWSRAAAKHAYLLHVLRVRLDFPRLRSAVLEQAEIHDATVVFIENHASGTQIIQQLRAENFGKLRPIKPVASKEIRMINQTAVIENGFVHLPEDAPWLGEYLHELAMFPKCKYFDQVDSTSQALEGIRNWTSHQGLFEFYRQEAAALLSPSDETWVMKGPDPVGCVLDREGVSHARQPDGCFHLKREHALPLINQIGWKRIG